MSILSPDHDHASRPAHVPESDSVRALGSSASSESDPRLVVCPPQAQWDSWLSKWQPILELSDWRIIVQVRSSKHLDNSKNSGECWSNIQNKIAVIKIPNDELKSEFLADGEFHDPECTLVHELLHCVLDFPCFQIASEDYRWKIGSMDDILYEQRINCLARALVRVDRMHTSKSTHDTERCDIFLTPQAGGSYRCALPKGHPGYHQP